MTTKNWIATAIVAPLIVGLILLQAEYSIFTNNSGSTKSIAKKTEEIVKQLEPVEKKDEDLIEPNLGNLETLFEVAGEIYGSTERNAEYVKIITIALNENKPSFAYKVAKREKGVKSAVDFSYACSKKS
jgi:hypothetical protein